MRFRSIRGTAIAAASLVVVIAACSKDSPQTTPAAKSIVTATWNGSQLDVVRVATADAVPVTPAPGQGAPALAWELDDTSGKAVASGVVSDTSIATAEFAADGTASPAAVTGTGMLEFLVPAVTGTLSVVKTTATGTTTTQSSSDVRLQDLCAGMPSPCTLATAAVPLSLTPPVDTSQYPLKKILDNGDCAPFNMLFVSEGYQSGEMSAFESTVQTIASGLPQVDGYAGHMTDFNIWVLEIPSADSGITDPGCAPTHPENMDDCSSFPPLPRVARNTAFGASFGDNVTVPRRSIQVGIASSASTLASNATLAAAQHQVNADVTGFIVNDPGNAPSGYGGSANVVSRLFTASSLNTNGNVVQVAAHESGHALFGLQDEYEVGSSTGQCELNSLVSNVHQIGIGPFPFVNISQSPTNVAWQALINTDVVPTTAADSTTVGAYQGGYYCPSGFYRSQNTCLMKQLGSPFCAACLVHVLQTIQAKEQAASACKSADAGSGSGVSCVGWNGNPNTCWNETVGYTYVCNCPGFVGCNYKTHGDSACTTCNPGGCGHFDVNGQLYGPIGDDPRWATCECANQQQ